jgi:nitroreductase
MTHPTLQAIAERRTTNLFDPARDIAVTQIGELVHLATRAPTSFNLQNWRFIAVHERASKARLRKLAWDQAKVTDAAVTFIVVGQLTDERVLAGRLQPVVDAGIMPAAMVPGWEGAARSLYNGQPQRQRDEAIRSATLGASTLMHAAQAMGLGSAPMIGFNADAVAADFGLGDNEIPVMLVAVG